MTDHSTTHDTEPVLSPSDERVLESVLAEPTDEGPSPSADTAWEPEFRGSLENQVKLIVALTAAMAEFKEIKKSVRGQTGKQEYKYTPLSSVIDASVPALAAQEIGFTQTFTSTDDPADKRRLLTSILAGHGAMMIVKEWFVSNVGNPTQYDGKVKTSKDLGGLETYLRRYATQAILFVEGDRDEDQNPNPEPYNDRPPTSQSKQQPRKPAPKQQPLPQAEATDRSAPQPDTVRQAFGGVTKTEPRPTTKTQKETISALYQRLLPEGLTKEQMQQKAGRDIHKRMGVSVRDLDFGRAAILITQLQEELNKQRDEVTYRDEHAS